MRTKTLLLTAAICAAGVLSSMAANVTSVNVVGYVNVNVPKGFSFIANQLVGASTTVSSLIPNPPSTETETTIIYKWNAGFDGNTFAGEWDNPDSTLNPGEGALIYAPAPFTVTFVGEVKQGTLNTPLPAGFSIISSQVPQTGGLVTDLKLNPADGSIVYKWNSGFDGNSIIGGEWDAGEPQIDVGSAFLYYNAGDAGTWSRTFSVN